MKAYEIEHCWARHTAWQGWEESGKKMIKEAFNDRIQLLSEVDRLRRDAFDLMIELRRLADENVAERRSLSEERRRIAFELSKIVGD